MFIIVIAITHTLGNKGLDKNEIFIYMLKRLILYAYIKNSEYVINI